MAMLRVITSSKVVPRAISSCGSITKALINGCDQVPLAISHHQYFSSDAKKQSDRKLIKLLKSEIKLQKIFIQKGMPETPSDFPFTVKDDANDIILTRDFEGEKIEVVVAMPDYVPEDDEIESDSNSSSDDDDLSSSSDEEKEKEKENEEVKNEKEPLSLRVKVSKENEKISEFEVYASADEIKVNSFILKEPAEAIHPMLLNEIHCGLPNPMLIFGPHDVDEEGDLQSALGEYLKIRGIDKRYYGFMHKYMLNKCRIRPVEAMMKLRSFIAD